MKNIYIALLFFAAFVTTQAQIPSSEIKKAIVAPVIDGMIDPVWFTSGINNISKAFRTETPSLGTFGQTYWRALWTNDGIYILLKVTDNSFYPSYAVNPEGQNWEYDKVEIFFDVNFNLKDGLGPSVGSGHYVIAPGFSEGMNDGTLFTDPSGYKYAYKVNEPDYVGEFFVPFSMLVDKDGVAIDKTGNIGFDITIIDRDPSTPTRSRAVWANVGTVDESWYNMDNCGTISLIQEYTVDVNQLNRLKEGTFPIEGYLHGPWYTWTNGIGDIEVIDGACKMTTNTIGQLYEMQLFQSGWQAYNDTAYVLLFTIWGDRNSTCNIHIEDDPAHEYVRLGTSNDPESNGQCDWTIPVTTEPVLWTLQGKMSGLDATSEPKLMIMTGDRLGSIYLDNFAIINENDLIISNKFELDLYSERSISCGQSFELNPFVFYNGSEAISYSWSPAEGLSATNISNPVVNSNKNITYTLTASVPGYSPIIKTVTVNVSPLSETPSICAVNVDENDRNVVVIKKEMSTAIESYFIYRESSLQTDQYDLIGLIPYSDNAVFVDSQSNAKVQSNKYKIAIKDNCGFVSGKSSEHKTLHLTINQGVGNNWNLIWEPYIGTPISSYKIFRGTNKSNLIEIAFTSGSNTSFTDITAPEDDLYYQITGMITESCTTLKSTQVASVMSNIVSNFYNSLENHDKSFSRDFLYPNPATDKIVLRPGYNTNAIIEIYNLLGEKVLTDQASGQIDISHLSSGLYIVKLVEPEKILMIKLVKK